MNDKPNFKPLPTPEAIRTDSPEGQKALSIVAVLGGVSGLAGMQALVNAFSFFFATATVEAGMDDDAAAKAVAEMSHLIEVNRSMAQKQHAGRPA